MKPLLETSRAGYLAALSASSYSLISMTQVRRHTCVTPPSSPWCARYTCVTPPSSPWCARYTFVTPPSSPWCARYTFVTPPLSPWCARYTFVTPPSSPWCARYTFVDPPSSPWCARYTFVTPPGARPVPRVAPRGPALAKVSLGLHADTVEMTLKALFGHLVTREVNSPTNSLRTL
eukprot:1600004-Pyramimonas_sp.AAC.2